MTWDFTDLYNRVKNSLSGPWQQVTLSPEQFTELCERIKAHAEDDRSVMECAAKTMCPMCRDGIGVDRFPAGYFHSEHLQEPSRYGSWPWPCDANKVRMAFEEPTHQQGQ